MPHAGLRLDTSQPPSFMQWMLTGGMFCAEGVGPDKAHVLIVESLHSRGEG